MRGAGLRMAGVIGKGTFSGAGAGIGDLALAGSSVAGRDGENARGDVGVGRDRAEV